MPSPRISSVRLPFAVAPILLIGLAFAPGLLRPVSASDPPTPQEEFTAKIEPLFRKYCYSCHGPNSNTGLDLTKTKTVEEIWKDPTHWQKVLSRIADKTMPPQGVPKPTDAEHSLLTAWIGHTLENTPERLIPKNPGRILIHRLSRAEYDHTVRDLFGVDKKLSEKFPADAGGGGGFDNNADTLYVPPVLMERYLEAATEILNAVDPKRLNLLPPAPGPGGKRPDETAAARKTLTRHASRAFRRPARTEEIDGLVRLFSGARKQGLPYTDALKFALKAVLISPHFLFRIEPESGAPGARPLNDYELASRLSYFLWSSMPDDTLFALAGAKRLGRPEVLRQQVVRMLKDPKADAFADSFAGQWLRVRELYTTAHPDPGKFPDFTPSLRDAMYQETIRFFRSVVTEDRSVYRLLNSDYTYLNEELAKHYGIAGVTGKEMRRVYLPDGKRGGVLSQASILTLSSYPQRTSPVLRGKWILGNLLGTPPPPPPPVVATLSSDDQPTREGLTFRQRLEKHREKPECSGCHARLDPLGFALENYDAIGRWREKIGEVPVDAVGALPEGAKFTGPVEFKQFLLANRKKEFVRHLTEQMLSYALGRGLEPYDQPAVRKIEETVMKSDGKAQTLIRAVTESYPFRYRMSDRPGSPAEPSKKVVRR
ncbi:MAG: DUF1592 domain-containing protein [Capsulimonadales bacterium]|nr:DUF1592 domain-containing protein [Capsulimonadales bacterium]